MSEKTGMEKTVEKTEKTSAGRAPRMEKTVLAETKGAEEKMPKAVQDSAGRKRAPWAKPEMLKQVPPVVDDANVPAKPVASPSPGVQVNGAPVPSTLGRKWS